MYRSSTFPSGYPLTYNIPPPAAKEKDPEPTPKERPETELAEEAVRDLITKRLVKQQGKESFLAFYSVYADQYAAHLPFLQVD